MAQVAEHLSSNREPLRSISTEKKRGHTYAGKGSLLLAQKQLVTLDESW
jgi:hypothetical protein